MESINQSTNYSFVLTHERRHLSTKMNSYMLLISIITLVIYLCEEIQAFHISPSTQRLTSLKSEISDQSSVASPETASISPGQVLTIRIGDTSLARKAWKKRRRTGSPILAPCTILSMNREMMVKMNILNIVNRFGKPLGYDSHNGVGLSVGAMVKLYKYRLGGELIDHATSLGYKTIVEFLENIFDDGMFREYGIKLIRLGKKRELFLSSSLSLRLARETSLKAEFVQFQPDLQNVERMVHTGTTFQVDESSKYQTVTDPSIIRPLSAAVRISQADADSGRFQTGMECNAFVHTYDSQGDNGSPLITCAIDPSKSQIRDQMKRRSYVKRQEDAKMKREEEMKVLSKTSHINLSDLKVGDGPFEATVVRVSARSSAAFVDLGVKRQKGKKHGGGTAQVLGMLRFDDIIDNSNLVETSNEEDAIIEASLMEDLDDDEFDSDDDSDDGGGMTIEDLFMNDDEQEFEEDISHLISIDDDGNVLSLDPESGDSTLIGSINSNDEPNESESDDDLNMFKGLTPQDRLRAIGDMYFSQQDIQNKSSRHSKDAMVECELKQGDKVIVYIRSVSNQSGRFMVTLDPNIKNRKLSDVKRELETDKRLMRLASKFGGEHGLKMIEHSIGKEMEGVIKARSKTGDWYYVSPDDEKFPVGVATSSGGKTYDQGQRVKIRLDGIDESRGQIALCILD